MRLTAQDWMRILAPTSSLVCSAEGDDNPGDGGGGDRGDGDGDGDERLQKLVDQKVNAALSNHLGRFRTSFEKDLDTKLSKSLEPVTGSLSELKDTLAKGRGDHKPDKTDEEAEELKKANARIAELERKNKEAEEHAQATERKRLSSEERTALTEALSQAGVDKNRIRAAVALLYNEDRRVKRDDEGNIVFLVPKAGYTDEVKLEDGIPDWLKTEEGKAFLPATGAAGSGATGSQRQQRRKGGPMTKEEKKAEARRTLMEAHGFRVPE